MNADNNKPHASVFGSPASHIGQWPDGIDASIRPEIDQNHFSPQLLFAQRSGIQPACGTSHVRHGAFVTERRAKSEAQARIPKQTSWMKCTHREAYSNCAKSQDSGHTPDRIRCE